MSDRPRRPGEDVVSWAVETGRILASREIFYRRELEGGRISEGVIEALASIDLPDVQPGTGALRAAAARYGGRSVRAASVPSGDPAAELLRGSTGLDSAYADGVAVSPAPELFPGGGSLPLATASGLDPKLMSGVPWWCRPGIAEASTLAEATDMLQCASGPDADLCRLDGRFIGARGLGEFYSSVESWAMAGAAAAGQREQDRAHEDAKMARAAASSAQPIEERSDDELYAEVFGAADSAKAAREAEWQRYLKARGGRS